MHEPTQSFIRFMNNLIQRNFEHKSYVCICLEYFIIMIQLSRKNTALSPLYLMLLSIALFLPIALKAQWLNCEEGNLKGKVRSLVMKHYKIIQEDDSLWTELAADNDPFWFAGYVDEAYSFNKDGKTMVYHAYFTDDADDNKTVNKYNKRGLLTEQTFFADGHQRGYMTYEYDNDGRISLITRFDEEEMITDLIHHIRDSNRKLPLYQSENNIWVYEYDLYGKCLQEKTLLPNGRLNFRNLFFYNENGKIDRMVTFDAKNQMISTISYDYNKSGQINQVTTSTPITLTVHRFLFDDFGNETECQTIQTDLQKFRQINQSSNKKTKSEYQKQSNHTSKYRYDKQNNWIERYYFADGIPQFAQKREIKYWK